MYRLALARVFAVCLFNVTMGRIETTPLALSLGPNSFHDFFRQSVFLGSQPSTSET